jgi:hypothetical protein
MAYARSVHRSVFLLSVVIALGLAPACSQQTGVADSAAVTTDSTSSVGGEPSTVADSTLPGEPHDVGPRTGQELDVISIRHDDVLNFRTLPDPSAPLVGTAVPQESAPLVASAGEGRLLVDSSVWWKVTIDGQDAWANFAYLGILGRTDDVLDELAAGSISVEGETVEGIVASIAASRGHDQEPRVTYVTPVVGATASDQSLTVDVVTLVDGSVKGERFGLRFEPTERGFRLSAADRTWICGREVVGEGECA